MPVPILPRVISQKGLSLVELMVSMAIGMLVVLAVSNIFLSNHAAFRSQEALAQIQQNARIAVELLAQDIREAGGNSCGIPAPSLNNHLANSAAWSANWGGGKIQGFIQTNNATPTPKAAGENVEDRVVDADQSLDSVIIRRDVPACDGNPLIIRSYSVADKTITLNDSHKNCITNGTILMACNFKQGGLFTASGIVDEDDMTIEHIENISWLPDGSAPLTNVPTGPAGALISRLSSIYWYIGHNDRGGRSLFRCIMDCAEPEEIAAGVHDIEIVYLSRDISGTIGAAFQKADSITNWDHVIAARLTLTILSSNNAGVDQQPIERTFINLISLRNQEVVQ